MARRAVQGFTEKSYFENVQFNGIVATDDPLQEGFFRHLVNLDITDTGQAVTPRKGFITTTIKHGGTRISLSKQTIIFKEPNTQKHIVYDHAEGAAYIVDITPHNINNDNDISVCDKVADIDWSHVLPYLTEDPFSISINTPVQVVNKSMVRMWIIKVEQSNEEHYVGMYYNDVEDTLIFDYIDMNELHTYLIHERNIASKASIIPDPFQRIRSVADSAGHVSFVGLIYAKDTDTDKYAVNMLDRNKQYDFIPHFDLKAPSEENGDYTHWFYRYEIINTRRLRPGEELIPSIFRSPWLRLHTANVPPYYLLNDLDTHDVDNVDVSKRHFKGVSVNIAVVPSSVTGSATSSQYPFNTLYDRALSSIELNRRTSWHNEADKVIDTYTLKNFVETLGATALYYINIVDEPTIYQTNMNTYKLGGFSIMEDQAHIYTPGTTDSTLTLIPTLDHSFFIEHPHSARSQMFSDCFFTHTQMLDIIHKGFFRSKSYNLKLFPSAMAYTQTRPEPLDDIEGTRFTVGPSSTPEELRANKIRYNMFHYNHKHRFWNGTTSPYTILDWVDSVEKLGVTNHPDDILTRYGFFEQGVQIRFYITPFKLASDYNDEGEHAYPKMREELIHFLTQGALVSHSPRVYAQVQSDVSHIPEVLTKDAEMIQEAHDYIHLDNHTLVVWSKNNLYISEPGEPNYFKEQNKQVFEERIVKVIQYKTVLLVFTVQHLYAVYQGVQTMQVFDPEEGTKEEDQVVWMQTRVLYNILTNDKYADAIQVFNQMVLFYSEDGQMFMIKPNTMIDVDTRFTLQYFNKAANDILANYDKYINERLKDYGVDRVVTRDEVQIKALLSVNYIRIYYSVPGVITYILIYDVINNRYTVYDTLSFTDVKELMFVEGGEAYITKHQQSLYLTTPYNSPYDIGHVDRTITNNHRREPVYALLDPGTLSLNNHLRKRLRELHLVFNNINAPHLLYSSELYFDNILGKAQYTPIVEVKEMHGELRVVEAFIRNDENLLSEQGVLFDFKNVGPHQMLTNKTTYVDMAKAFRLRIHLRAEGKYKVRGFGIVYKERRV